MNEENIQSLMSELKGLRYTSEAIGHSMELLVFTGESFPVVENTIRQWLLTNYEPVLAELKAKIFVYEEIIKKNTFAPLLNGEDTTHG